ncbi:MAG: VWA domain-containing protein [Caldilineae bacterium]|nr:VWA domain-containing protein [Chloroflexota bacterium]MCB9176078.1 VWA domain-containing protein [Caldilineae bacterium]
MRRAVRVSLASTPILLLALVAGPTLAAPRPGAPPTDPNAKLDARVTDCPSDCAFSAGASAHPVVLLSGEDTTVTLRLKASCGGYAIPRHIVLAVDGSNRIDRRELVELQSGLRKLVDQLDLPHNPSTRVALVDMADGPRTLLHLVNDGPRLKQRIGRLEAEGEPDAAALLDEAHRVFRQARGSGCDQQPVIDEIVILLSAAIDSGDCEPALRAARPLKGDGILMLVVNAEARSRDDRCLRQVASSARYYSLFGGLAGAITTLERIRDGDGLRVMPRQLTVVETLGPGLDFLPSPDAFGLAPEFDAKTRSLTWKRDFVPRDGITLSYRVRPSPAGLRALGEGARVTWRDTLNRVGAIRLERPWAQVFEPAPQRP